VARLVFFSGPYQGKSVGIPQGKTITLGRNRDLELSLPDSKLSRRHCQIGFRDEHYVLKDLKSTNGTFVNGERLDGEAVLNDFDRIVIGDIEIEFHHSEKVPLPLSFDTAAADPFGLAEDKDEVEIESLQQLEERPQEVPTVRGAAETGKRPATPAAPLPPRGTTVSPRAPSRAPTSPLSPPAHLDAPRIHALVEIPRTPEPHAKPPSGIQRVAVALAPDLLEAALRDLDLPLPPEPSRSVGTGQEAEARPQLMFCVVCEGSIPTLDYDLGVARLVEEQLVCGECLAKGARPVPSRSVGTAPRTVAAQRTEEKKKSVDEILKALDEEAVIIDTAPKRAGKVAPGAGEAGSKAAPKDVPEELGEEFEEIG